MTGCSITAQKKFQPQKVIQNDEFIIVTAKQGDNLKSLAKQYLGDPDKDWIIGDFNQISSIKPGQEVVIPLKQENPVGVFINGYQTVPILCYHRFGLNQSSMVITPSAFNAQMAYLKNNGYHVIPLADIAKFIYERKPIPRKSVVITMDDGYKSAYLFAFPILRKYNFPATLFVYTDFIGTTGGLTWPELQDLQDSGLIDIQPHSKTHRNLAVYNSGEDTYKYKENIKTEIAVPSHLLTKHLGVTLQSYAYPFGDSTDTVIDDLKKYNYTLGLTVQPGGNPEFAYPFMLRRTMIFGTHDLEAFKNSLDVFEKADLL